MFPTSRPVPGVSSLRYLPIWLFAISPVLFAQAPTLFSSANPSTLGQAVTLTATVAGGATGKVTFYSGATILGSASVAGSQAQFTTALLPAGRNPLTAYYLGDATHTAGLSAAVTQTVNAVASSNFAAPVNNTAVNPSSIAQADFNGDGKLDLVSVGFATGGNIGTTVVQMLLGNGNGTFQPSTTVISGTNPQSLVVGDFNLDGKPDLALIGTPVGDPNQSTAGVVIALGNGDGTFQSPLAPFDVLALGIYNYFSGAIAADLNRDGIPDLVVFNGFEVPVRGNLAIGSGANIFLGNGDGTFRAGPVYSFNPWNVTASTAVIADFTGDGIPDLATYSYGVLPGVGDGSFNGGAALIFPITFPVGLVAMTVADFNLDGKLDIAATNGQLLLGKGDGTFTAFTFPAATAGTFPDAIATADINGDGSPDLLLTLGSGGPYLNVLFGTGTGAFQTPIIYPFAYRLTLLGDFNGDGKVDLASPTSSTALGVLLGGGAPSVSVTITPGGTFRVGQPGGIYNIALASTSWSAVTGTVTVTDTLPTGFTATSISGTGWTCTLNTVSCTRSDGLFPAAAWPTISVGVSVASSVSSGTYTDQGTANASGTSFTGSSATTVLPAFTVPAVNLVTPNGASGLSQTFTATFSHNGGYGDLTTVDILFATAVNGAGACLVEYTINGNTLRLMNDAGNGFSLGYNPGTGTTLSNSQCTLSTSAATVSLQGTYLSVSVPIVFAAAFAGAKNIYLNANGVNLGAAPTTTGYTQLGTFTVATTGGVPQPVSIAPGSGSGTSGTFTGTFNHTGGGSQHYLEYLLLLPTPNVVSYTAQGSCLTEYNKISGGWRLVNDAGTDWLPAGVPQGQTTGTLSNSVCTLNIANSSATLAGATLTVKYAVTFNAPFTGTLGTYLQELDVTGQWAGVTQFGNWTAFPGSAKPGPVVTPATPATGSGSGATFTTTFGHSSGLSSIYFTTLLVSASIVGSPACQIFYFEGSNTINLINDAGTGFVSSAGVSPGSSIAALSNSKCSVTAASVTPSTNSAILSVTVGFTAANFAGPKGVYVQAFDTGGLTSEWVGGASWTVQ